MTAWEKEAREANARMDDDGCPNPSEHTVDPDRLNGTLVFIDTETGTYHEVVYNNTRASGDEGDEVQCFLKRHQ